MKRPCQDCGRSIYVKIKHPHDKFTEHHDLCAKCFRRVFTQNVPKPSNQNHGVHA